MINMTKEQKFPVEKISIVAERESWRKEINRPIYHIHKWWAQRLGSVFRALLLYLIYPQKDTWEEFYKTHEPTEQIILDPFMGSGTTIGEAIKIGTKAIGCDINPISSFLVKQELTKVTYSDLLHEFCHLQETVAKEIQKNYLTINPDTGKEIPVLYYFWVKVVTTPNGEEIPLFNNYVFAKNAYASKKPEASIICPKCWKVFRDNYNSTDSKCPFCGNRFNPQEGPASQTTVIDSFRQRYKIRNLIPKNKTIPEKMYAVLAIDEFGNKRYLSITEHDINLYDKAEKELFSCKYFIPTYEVKPGYNTDQARAYNYLFWKDFYNSRQLLCLGKLLSAVMKIENQNVREQFLCLFSSTLEFNNMFCSYKGEGTGAVRPIFSNHILKPERTPLENSIWGLPVSSGCFSTLFKSRLIKAKEYLDNPFEIKIDETTGRCTKVMASMPINPRIASSWEDLNKDGNVLVLNGDSARLPIPNASIDYVVTDPPYFDFIHYSELSDFFFAWLSPILKSQYPYFATTTSRRDNEVQQTDPVDFSNMLSRVFSESFRVLKNEGKLAFSFHHSRVEGWTAISKAISDSGFYIGEIFPLHAELMASTPKAGAKEPISLDSMIICNKFAKFFTVEYVVTNTLQYLEYLKEKNNRLSKTDIFVVCASQSLYITVNNRFDVIKTTETINDIFRKVLDRFS